MEQMYRDEPERFAPGDLLGADRLEEDAETGEEVGTIKARIHRAKAAFRRLAKEGELT